MCLKCNPVTSGKSPALPRATTAASSIMQAAQRPQGFKADHGETKGKSPGILSGTPQALEKWLKRMAEKNGWNQPLEKGRAVLWEVHRTPFGVSPNHDVQDKN